jgi:hypothetical protein
MIGLNAKNRIPVHRMMCGCERELRTFLSSRRTSLTLIPSMIRTLKFATTLAVAIQMTTVVAGPYDGWKPHKYCNAIENIEETNIQPLNDAQKARVASLEQVQVIARHGGRAPYARLPCWDDKHHNPMKAEWTCTATSVSVCLQYHLFPFRSY